MKVSNLSEKRFQIELRSGVFDFSSEINLIKNIPFESEHDIILSSKRNVLRQVYENC
jgi:hypothetical protein